MACETLEQMVYDNGFSQCRAVGTIDAYAMGAYAQYAGPVCEMGGLHECGIDGWNSTDHGPRPVGSASAADYDPYGGRSLPGPYNNAYGAFDEGAILGGWKNPLPKDKPDEGFGADFGVRTGYVNDIVGINGCDILFRIRPDKPHRGAEYEHLNLETIYSGNKRKPIIDNIHEPFEWR